LWRGLRLAGTFS